MVIDGLKVALEIVQVEKREAIQINPQMAMGMAQIEMLLKKKIEKLTKSS